MFPVMPEHYGKQMFSCNRKKKKKVVIKPGEAQLQPSRMGEDPRKPGLPPTWPLPHCESLGQSFNLDQCWPINQAANTCLICILEYSSSHIKIF